MRKFKNILVCLDLAPESRKDEAVINYAAYLSGLLRPDRVTLFHVAKTSDLPDQLKVKYLPEARCGPFKVKINEMIKNRLKTVESFDPEIHVLFGDLSQEIFKCLKFGQMDLVILGKGASAKASLAMSDKLASKAVCSVLIVPEDFKAPRITKIAVAIDFSPLSKMAFESGCYLAEAAKLKALTIWHACADLPKYIRTEFGSAGNNFNNDAVAHAKDEMSSLLKSALSRSGMLKFNEIIEYDSRPANLIEQLIVEQFYDLCVIGAQGRSAFAHFFLGSLTKKLMRKLKIPLLIAKDAEGISRLETLAFNKSV